MQSQIFSREWTKKISYLFISKGNQTKTLKLHQLCLSVNWGIYLVAKRSQMRESKPKQWNSQVTTTTETELKGDWVSIYGAEKDPSRPYQYQKVSSLAKKYATVLRSRCERKTPWQMGKQFSLKGLSRRFFLLSGKNLPFDKILTKLCYVSEWTNAYCAAAW